MDFQQLLQSGQDQLRRFSAQDDWVQTSTGVEETLNGEFMDQMIAINSHIYTTASTNEPDALPFFQPFFIEGVCRLSTAQQLHERLTPEYCWVVYQNPVTTEYYDNSQDITIWQMASPSTPLNPDDNMYLLSEYLSRNDLVIGREVLDYANNELFYEDLEDPIVGILIEDSCPCRKDLYHHINLILAELPEY